MTDEPRELSDVKDKLTEEHDTDIVEKWGIDSGHEVLQVLADALELEAGESGEDSTCQRRWTSRIRVRILRFEVDFKPSELGQRGDACGHCLRWNVATMRYPIKLEIDKVFARQKKSR
jgi:hypothetical protein